MILKRIRKLFDIKKYTFYLKNKQLNIFIFIKITGKLILVHQVQLAQARHYQIIPVCKSQILISSINFFNRFLYLLFFIAKTVSQTLGQINQAKVLETVKILSIYFQFQSIFFFSQKLLSKFICLNEKIFFFLLLHSKIIGKIRFTHNVSQDSLSKSKKQKNQLTITFLLIVVIIVKCDYQKGQDKSINDLI
ncbi:hypothetical protein ABPG74_006885 [Tetrahymena malaccensis]